MQSNNTRAVHKDLSQRINPLSETQSECTIYRVHGHLRNINNKAYEPEVIAIGPYHRSKDNLTVMEDHKLRYLHLLLQSKSESIEKYVSVIRPLEPEARKCYAEPISLNETEFTETLVLDGCFIIQLARKCSMIQLREKDDPIFHMNWIMNSLQRDLMLFENQIPFFVMCKLFDLIEFPNQHYRLIYLLQLFFRSLYPVNVMEKSVDGFSHKFRHLLELIHYSMLPSQDGLNLGEAGRDRGKEWRFINNASWLTEANVKFERNEGDDSFKITFRNGTMLLAPLTVEDRTESFFRNLIVYEQYFQETNCNVVTDYVKFLDCLIDSSRDVEILSSHGIIDNWLGNDEVVANVFNRLTDSVARSGSRFLYADIFVAINKHCNKRRNNWMAKLRRNYLNSPWAIISIVAAVALLLLTIVQTVCSILQVV